MDKLWYQENRERCLELARKWKREHRNDVREMKRRSYHKHKAIILARQKEYYRRNSEKIGKRLRKWYDSNKDKKAAYDRNYRLNLTDEQKQRNRARSSAYAKAHPEINRKWQNENPELAKASKLKWSRANPDIALRWAKSHPELVKAYKLKYHLKNPQAASKWKREHPELYRECQRQWARANPGKVRAASNRRRARLKNALTDDTATVFYTFVRSKDRIRCYYCGEWFSGKEVHVDHVIALSKDGNHASENLCASCPKCNLKKGSKLPSEIQFIDQKLLNL
jgi:5-methylcytosine-specific restriction endonuclease McrA